MPKASTTQTTQVWLTIGQAATYAGVSQRTIRNWIDDSLEHRRLNHQFVRVHPNSIDEYLHRKHVTKDATVIKRRVDAAVKDICKRGRRKLPPNSKG